MNLVIILGKLYNISRLDNPNFFIWKKGNRRRKYRNRKNREKKLHGKDQQLKEYNGAGKLVEDHISVRIEEEKGSYIFLFVYTIHNIMFTRFVNIQIITSMITFSESVYETFSPRNSGCQNSMFLSNILHSCGSTLVSNSLWIYSWYESSICFS